MIDAVKTEKEAIKRLQRWLDNEEMKDYVQGLSGDTVIEDASAQCQCGQTSALRAFYEGGKHAATIAICNCCGKDDAFDSDVIDVW